MARGTPEVDFAFPTPTGWERNLLIGLLLGYVAELLVARFIPEPQMLYQTLAWASVDEWSVVTAPWQPLTRYLVQGNNAVGVLFSLLILFFALPILNRLIETNFITRGFIAAMVGGTLLPLAVQATGLVSLPEPLMGWGQLIWVPLILIGLILPNYTLYLIVFPVEARWLMWAALVIPAFQTMLSPSAASLEMIGAWLGPFFWYHFMGPRTSPPSGPPRRESDLEKLRRFQVIQGGAGNSPDDDWVH